MRANEQGVTLLEIIFVLIVAGTFVILALRQYQIFQLDADVNQVKANVHTLFQAMSSYYKANCIQNRDYNDPSIPLTQGALDPTAFTLPPEIPINITQDLIPTYLARWPVTDVPSIVDNEDGKGYIVQFNRISYSGRTIPVGNNNRQIGQIYYWNIQVAVKLANPDLATTFQNLLIADCRSTLGGTGGDTVTPCSQDTGNSGNYLVWSLSPSYALGQSSILWPTTPLLLQFKRQYTTDDMRSLSDPNFANSQYYLCGG